MSMNWNHKADIIWGMKYSFFAVLLLFPYQVFAQIDTITLVPCAGPDCQACHVVQLAQNLIEFAIYFAIFLGIAMFAYAGFLMVTSVGDTNQVTRAKSIFRDVAIGFVIVLAGWLVVDTLMKFFFQSGQGTQGSVLFEETKQEFGPWNQIRCVDLPSFSRVGNAPGALNANQDGTVKPGSLEDGEARGALESNRIPVHSSGNCTDPNIRTCTSLHGIREDTVDQVLAIKEACGAQCPVIVTGGTETGHAGGALSHGSGHKIDLEDSAELNQFLESRLTPDGHRSGSHGGRRFRDKCGNEYVRESSHWDITISNGSCTI